MKMQLLAVVFTLAVQPSPRDKAVVFVCEHGAAKSVVATAYFNKLAAERGLPFRATFRGTVPQDNLSVRAVEGLKADGVAFRPESRPRSATRMSRTRHTSSRLAAHCRTRRVESGKSADWSDVPDDQGYAPMRDAIVRHVKQLLDELQR